MFCIRVTYLTGRVYAARFEEGDDKHSVEWPPHPGRFFEALVAAWGETGKSREQQSFLEWLEALDPPTLRFDARGDHRVSVSTQESVTTYVPVNDSNDQFHRIRGSFFQTITDRMELRRDRKARRFPSFTPEDAAVHFVWDVELPADHRAALEELLRHVTYLGHSSSLVGADVLAMPPADGYRLQPHLQGAVRLRVPTAGRLARLEEQHARFLSNPVKTNRPDAGPSVLYSDEESRHSPTGIFREMLILRRVSGDRLPLISTLQLTAALRGAALSFFPNNGAPEFISGHAPGSTPGQPIRSEKPHLAFVPLADVGHDHARGYLMGVAALVPRTLTAEEADVCAQAIATAENLVMGRAGAWTVEPAPTIDAPFALRPETWTQAAKRWATVTPFVFDRYPRDLQSEEAEEIVRTACGRILSTADGQPLRPEHVTLVAVSPHYGVPIARSFPSASTRPGKPKRCHFHVILHFAEKVRGPLVIGAGRYYGYGLCRPLV